MLKFPTTNCESYSTWTWAKVVAARFSICEPGPCVGVAWIDATLNFGLASFLESFFCLP